MRRKSTPKNIICVRLSAFQIIENVRAHTFTRFVRRIRTHIRRRCRRRRCSRCHRRRHTSVRGFACSPARLLSLLILKPIKHMCRTHFVCGFSTYDYMICDKRTIIFRLDILR